MGSSGNGLIKNDIDANQKRFHMCPIPFENFANDNHKH